MCPTATSVCSWFSDALMEHRSVTRAADALGLTQSAVSHTLRALRARLDDPLLIRIGNALHPTPRALALRPSLSLGLAALERVLGGEADFHSRPVAAALHSRNARPPTITVLPGLIGQIGRDAPNVDIRVRPIGPGLADELASGRLDVVLAGAEVEHQLALDRELMRMRVISEPFRCVLPTRASCAAGILR